MAKDLYIIRHAKSDWSFDLSDFDRPLNTRGFQDAPHMARKLRSIVPELEFLISSPAKRAITTAQIFAEEIGYAIRGIKTEQSIYEASTTELLEVINHIDDTYSKVGLFGHNPGLTTIVNYLTDQLVTANIPTCGIVHLHFPDINTWSHISGGNGYLKKFLYPKDDGQ